MAEMAEIAKNTINLSHTGNTTFLPNPLPYADLAATKEYDAATISSIVFGIFMALLTLYTIWQQRQQWKGKYRAKSS